MNQKKSIFSRSKLLIVTALLVSLLSVSFVGETGAWLVSTSGADSTTMTKVTPTTLTIGGNWPKITVKNNSNIPMYVRAVFCVNYINDTAGNWNNGSSWEQGRLYLARTPKSAAYTNDDGTTQSAEYSYTVGSGWTEKTFTEGIGNATVTWKILYYTAPLAAGATSNPMFTAFSGNVDTRTVYVHNKQQTFSLTFDVMVDSIQAETASRFSGGVTDTALYKAWGVKPASVGGNMSTYPTGDAYVNP